jgi:FkbM family methyltransferase
MTQTAPAATGLRLLIPRVFHQIWLGGPMPEKEQRFAESWTRHHPGWERRLWHDGNLPELRNQALFDIAPTLAQKADILRFELLLDHGGVYVDGDFECLRNIEPLLDGVRAFCGREDAMRVSNALIGCVPGHPLLDAVVAALPDAVGWLPDRGPNEQTGPDLLTRIVLEQESIGAETATVFGPEVFYPYHWSELHRADEEFPEAFAAHRWSGRMWYAKDGIQSESSEPARQEESVAQGTRLIVDVDPDLVEPGAVVLSAALAVVSAFKGELALVVPGVDEITDSIGGALSGVINQVSPLPDLPDTVVYGESEGRTLSGALRVALSADPAQNARTVLDLARLAPDAAHAATAPAAATAPVAAPPAAAPPGPAAVYVGNGRLLVRTAWGDKLYCDAADLSITPDLALNGTFDEPLCAFVRRWLQPGDTAVDVGANIGVLTLLMARAVGRQGRVVAYEASPHTAALLRDNVAVNYRNDWVQVREQAAWSEQTRLTFHVSERFQGNGSLLGHDEWYQGHFRVDEHRQIEVEAVALGPVLADLRPKLVKIDVEGAEPDVLAGMADWLDSARGVAIAVEVVKHRMGDRWRLFAAQMQGLVDDGWGLALLQPDGTPVAVDPATVLRVGWFDNVLFLR